MSRLIDIKIEMMEQELKYLKLLRNYEDLSMAINEHNDQVTAMNKAIKGQVGGERPEITISAEELGPELDAILSTIMKKVGNETKH